MKLKKMCLQFNYLTAPTANNHINVNLVHHQQKNPQYVSHPPYSEQYYCYDSSSGNNNIRTHNSSTPNSTIRSVKNYRKPHPPSTSGATLNYNIVAKNHHNTSSNNINNNNNINSSSTSSYSATNPLMTNNLNSSSYSTTPNTNSNHMNSSYKFNNSNVSQNSNHVNNNNSNNNNNSHVNGSNISYFNKQQHNNSATDNVTTNTTATNLSRRSSQQSSSTSSHEWMSADKSQPHSLSLCINRINLKKSNKSSSSESSGGAQFQSMRCRKHRNRNHFFNTSSSTSYQKYKLTKSCSNDTVNSSEQPEFMEKHPTTTYKFI
jgi:hypothetical protein